jgi:hypothetical protein
MWISEGDSILVADGDADEASVPMIRFESKSSHRRDSAFLDPKLNQVKREQ